MKKRSLPLLEEFQVIFTLYEKLKHEEMSWEDCEEYVMEQISPTSKDQLTSSHFFRQDFCLIDDIQIF